MRATRRLAKCVLRTRIGLPCVALACGALALSWLLPESRAIPSGPRENATLHDKEKLGLSDESYASLRAAVEKARYTITAAPASDATAGDPAYAASNPRQKLRARFGPDEVRLTSTDANQRWSLGLRLSGYGRGEARLSLPPPEIEATENRIAYKRGVITEWYVNDSKGIEQGFTLDARPGGHETSAPLYLEMVVLGDLTPSAVQDAGEISFATKNGKSVLRYAKLLAEDAHGRPLPAAMRLVAAAKGPDGRKRTIRLTVDDTDAVYPVTIDPLFDTMQLTASDAAAGDLFGISVDIDFNTAVVGAWLDDLSGVGIDAGSAYVFLRTGTTWGQEAKLTAGSDADAEDQFGISVAVSGDKVVVGAPLNDDGGNATGAAYVFLRTGTSWANGPKLVASDATADDQLGFSVAFDGKTAVVGAPFGDALPVVDSGAAYVFVEPPAGWSGTGSLTETLKLTASDATAGDEFGFSVAVDENADNALIGARKDDNAGGIEAGAAYGFRVTTGAQQAPKLVAFDGAALDWFGHSVSISGNRAVVGAPQADNPGINSGAAYGFDFDGASWAVQIKFPLSVGVAGPGDLFGVSVANTASLTVIGAMLDDDAGADAGSAYVFARSGPNWIQQQKVTDPPNPPRPAPAAGDEFGFAVAISGDTAIVGAPLDNVPTAGVDAGSAWILSRIPVPNGPDIDGDGDVDAVDLVPILTAFGSVPGDPSWDPTVDALADDVINIMDIIFWAYDFPRP